MSTIRTIGQLAVLAIALGATAAADAQLPNRAEPLPGVTTSGQPDETSLEELAQTGFAAVIDLRTPDEEREFDERAVVERLGMRYIALPITRPDGVSYEHAAALDEILREAGGPVLIHCSTGNRAGALLSLQQRLVGATPAQALETGIDAGMTSPALRTTVELLLASPPRL